MGLLATTGGTGPTEDNFEGNFAGGRLSAVNVTRDGFNVTDGRYVYGALTSTYTRVRIWSRRSASSQRRWMLSSDEVPDRYKW